MWKKHKNDWLCLEVLSFWQREKLLGRKVYICSSAPEFIVEVIAADLGADAYCGSSFYLNEDGEIEQYKNIVDGPYKKKVMQKLKKQGQLIVKGYGDSWDDEAFLLECDEAILVRAPYRLRKRRGWKSLL